jgi:hypothetical protein
MEVVDGPGVLDFGVDGVLGFTGVAGVVDGPAAGLLDGSVGDAASVGVAPLPAAAATAAAIGGEALAACGVALDEPLSALHAQRLSAPTQRLNFDLSQLRLVIMCSILLSASRTAKNRRGEVRSRQGARVEHKVAVSCGPFTLTTSWLHRRARAAFDLKSCAEFVAASATAPVNILTPRVIGRAVGYS